MRKFFRFFNSYKYCNRVYLILKIKSYLSAVSRAHLRVLIPSSISKIVWIRLKIIWIRLECVRLTNNRNISHIYNLCSVGRLLKVEIMKKMATSKKNFDRLTSSKFF
jgi:hypothetical protein